jgi:predicted enzyme related to lactoylglutathione lyase
MGTPQNQPGTFCWYECGTRDAAAAKKFYTELFGWKAVDVPMPGEMGGHYTMLKVGEEDVAGLYEMRGPQFENVPPHWMTYVNSANVDESVTRAKSLGATILADPMDIPGVGRLAVLQDPTGATISVFKMGEHHGTAQLGTTHGAFCWSELATRDTAAAKTFYTSLFDWGAKVDDNPEMPYTEFQVSGTSVAGMMAMGPQHGDAPPHWMPYVAVSDCNAAAEKVEQLGGQVVVPPMDVPNVGRFSVIADPTGAHLAMITLQS